MRFIGLNAKLNREKQKEEIYQEVLIGRGRIDAYFRFLQRLTYAARCPRAVVPRGEREASARTRKVWTRMGPIPLQKSWCLVKSTPVGVDGIQTTRNLVRRRWPEPGFCSKSV